MRKPIFSELSPKHLIAGVPVLARKFGYETQNISPFILRRAWHVVCADESEFFAGDDQNMIAVRAKYNSLLAKRSKMSFLRASRWAAILNSPWHSLLIGSTHLHVRIARFESLAQCKCRIRLSKTYSICAAIRTAVFQP